MAASAAQILTSTSPPLGRGLRCVVIMIIMTMTMTMIMTVIYVCSYDRWARLPSSGRGLGGKCSRTLITSVLTSPLIWTSRYK